MARNLQGNSIVEAVHKLVGQFLFTLIYVHHPQTIQQAKAIAHSALAMAMRATRCVAHRGLNHFTSGALALHCDMSMDIPFITNIVALQHLCQQQVNHDLLQENSKCISHDFIVNDQVMKKSVLSLSNKLKPSFSGPFSIQQVYTNGTCTIHLSPNMTECINIQRLKPYHS